MKLIKVPFGVLLIEDGELKDKEIFKDPQKAANYFLEGKIRSKVKEFKERYPEAEVESPTNYLEIGEEIFGEELNSYLNQFFRHLTRGEIKKGFSQDLLIKQAIRALEDLEEINNRVFERAIEWFNFYYPEAADKLAKMDDFYSKVEKLDRDQLREKLGLEKISMGSHFSELDKKRLEGIIEIGKNINKKKEKIREYIETKMKEVAPNLTEIAGPEVGARLISIAGNLKKLAKQPASTIQVLGAEEALFKHLKEGTPSPKYGVLFNHPMVKQVKKDNRGKMARTLASKIAIAARTDYYSDRKVYESLKRDLKKRKDQLC